MQDKNINFSEPSDFGNPYTGLRFQSVLWGGARIIHDYSWLHRFG